LVALQKAGSGADAWDEGELGFPDPDEEFEPSSPPPPRDIGAFIRSNWTSAVVPLEDPPLQPAMSVMTVSGMTDFR